MRFPILASILLLCPSAALSRQSQADALASLGIKVVEPMSADELARTKARVAAELARAGATPAFQDISSDHGGRAVHLPSGLICPLGKKGQRLLLATPHSASCETINDGTVYRQTVERALPGASLDWAAAFARSNAEREPGYKPSTGLSITARPRPGSGAAEHRTLRYDSRASGRERSVRLQVGFVRGWVLTERTETRKGAQPNSLADILSEATFGLSMKPD